MEYPKSLGVPCPIHPTEFIQRVNTDINASQQLYCMECILQQDDPHFDTSTLKSIKDLIATAANFYQHNKDKAKIAEDVPSDFAEALSGQAESLEKLSKHIEEEKKRASYIFDMISKDFLRVIEDKKNEYLYSLDQQLFNLRYWYIFFDKQIKKAYPLPEDIPFLFPTQEDLTNKLQKITNSTQLMAFVRNIKEDLNEQKLGLRVDQKAYLNTLRTELTKIENTKPILNVEDSCMTEIKSSLKKTLEDTLDKLLVLENPIKDVVKGKDFDSKLLKPEHFDLIKTWIPKEYKFNLKLLYRASRDGMSGSAFHSKCDGKGATLTVVKCEFNGSNKVSLMGGFMDQNWNQTGQYINSTKAFLYSVTKKVKCPVKTNQHAGYGNGSYGPTFGSGHDLCVWAGAQSYVNPNGYTDTMKLVETPNYAGGQGHFKPLDVEVYLIS